MERGDNTDKMARKHYNTNPQKRGQVKVLKLQGNITHQHVLANIVLDRLTPYSKSVLGEYQEGFRKFRSTIDQVYTLR